MKELPWTGERLVTSLNTSFGVIEHLHRYALATEFCKNKVVLDIACGEGYGSNLLSKIAKQVIGVDISGEAIKHALNKYQKENLSFQTGRTSNIPCENNSIDVVVSFETIEHHDEHIQMIDEIHRVLKKDGMLIVSSPEKSIYSSRDPNNPFHVKELELKELLKLINKRFNYTIVLNQRFVLGSLIEPAISGSGIFGVFDGDFNEIKKELTEYAFFNRPFFNVVLCSNNEINLNNQPLVSFYNGCVAYEQILNEKDKALGHVLNSKRYRLGSFLLRPLIAISKVWRLIAR